MRPTLRTDYENQKTNVLPSTILKSAGARVGSPESTLELCFHHGYSEVSRCVRASLRINACFAPIMTMNQIHIPHDMKRVNSH